MLLVFLAQNPSKLLDFQEVVRRLNNVTEERSGNMETRLVQLEERSSNIDNRTEHLEKRSGGLQAGPLEKSQTALTAKLIALETPNKAQQIAEATPSTSTTTPTPAKKQRVTVSDLETEWRKNLKPYQNLVTPTKTDMLTHAQIAFNFWVD
ncbi:hypothetical protein SNE40_023653 [Patella caerulea]